MSTQKAVIAEGIVKTYGSKKEIITALKDVSFDVDRGELFGIIGADGAGKTSLFRVLTTLLLADSGHAHIDGLNVVKDYKRIRQHVGYMPGKFSLYQDLTVLENLEFFATIFGTSISANYHLIKDIYSQIEPFKHRKAGKLSGGMKQKLALSCALIHRPSVLFLDEPTTGVDAVSRKEFWDMLKNLKQEGITILVSTPYMDEASLCDRVALIQEGKIMSVNTPQGVVSNFKSQLFALRAPNMFALLKEFQHFDGTEDIYAFGEDHHLVLKTGYEQQNIENFALSRGFNVQVRCISPVIEDCFISLMKSS